MRDSPANAGETTVARKWSPPPVQSSTSAMASGMAASMRLLDIVGRGHLTARG